MTLSPSPNPSVYTYVFIKRDSPDGMNIKRVIGIIEKEKKKKEKNYDLLAFGKIVDKEWRKLGSLMADRCFRTWNLVNWIANAQTANSYWLGWAFNGAKNIAWKRSHFNNYATGSNVIVSVVRRRRKRNKMGKVMEGRKGRKIETCLGEKLWRDDAAETVCCDTPNLYHRE